MILLLQDGGDTFAFPDVNWGGLSPLLVMAGVPLVFLTVWSLTSHVAPRRTPSIVAALAGIGTIVAAAIQWGMVSGDETPGFSTLASAYAVDGFSNNVKQAPFDALTCWYFNRNSSCNYLHSTGKTIG